MLCQVRRTLTRPSYLIAFAEETRPRLASFWDDFAPAPPYGGRPDG